MATPSHVVLPGSYRPVSPGAHAVGVANPDAWVEVTVKLRRKAELPDVTDRPAKPMTRAELAKKYGASSDDMKKAAAAFEKYGLEVLGEDDAARTLRLGGPVSAMEEAFQVKLLRYETARGNYRGRTGQLQVPAGLRDIVVGVFGLDTRRVVRRRAHAAAAEAEAPINAAAKSRPWFFPAELAKAYQFPDGDGAGQCIGLLEFGGGYFPDDLKGFCNSAETPVPKVIPVGVDHTPTDRHDGAEGEVMLDIEVVAGVCPKAAIAVYFGQFTEQGWIDTLDAALHDAKNNPTVLSISWGLAEDDPNWSRGALDAISEALKVAALLGVTVCVAAGDDGSDDQVGDGHAHVDFPSSSPYALCVGGTTLHVRNGKRDEKAWKDGDGLRADGGGSTGGGVSVHFPRPAWQTVSVASVNPGAIDGRVVPDVAADASANTGYFTVVDGKPGISGGTSASAPLWAALVARINAKLPDGKRVGYLTPLLYKPAPAGGGTVGSQGCNDITAGDNITAHVGGYKAGPGYDAVTGWGTPIGTQLLTLLGKMV